MVSYGPYDTEADAAGEPMPRVVAVAGDRGAAASMAGQYLRDTCAACCVELGDYDRRVLDWLARWEPVIVQVIAGLVRRAYQAGRDSR